MTTTHAPRLTLQDDSTVRTLHFTVPAVPAYVTIGFDGREHELASVEIDHDLVQDTVEVTLRGYLRTRQGRRHSTAGRNVIYNPSLEEAIEASYRKGELS